MLCFPTSLQRKASPTAILSGQPSADFGAQAIRGGRVKLGTLTAPEMDYSNEEKGDALHAMEFGAFLKQT